jgi:hypothetical protein
MVDDQRDNAGQLFSPFVLLEILLPDLDHVAQQLKRQQLIDVALVFEQQVDEAGLSGYAMRPEVFFRFPCCFLAENGKWGLRSSQIKIEYIL